MLQVRTYIAASPIEGVGVFAAEAIAKGTVIWRSDPTFDLAIPIEQYQASPPHVRELLERYAYPSTVQPGFMIYETDNGRFMNHSAAPNTDYSEPGFGTAAVDIAKGEELTCDYGQFYATDVLPMPEEISAG